jgi:hypothetical protein
MKLAISFLGLPDLHLDLENMVLGHSNSQKWSNLIS